MNVAQTFKCYISKSKLALSEYNKIYLSAIAFLGTPGTCVSYQIYMPQLYFNENSRTVRYQIEHVHGLPVVRERISDDFYTYGEVMAMLERQFLSFADLVAYKGGTIERDLLSSMGVKSLILRCWVAQSTLNY